MDLCIKKGQNKLALPFCFYLSLPFYKGGEKTLTHPPNIHESNWPLFFLLPSPG
jgi:hypothetical protein